MHGGSLPQVRRAAARRLEAERTARTAAAWAERLGGRLDIDPLDALLAVVQGAAADDLDRSALEEPRTQAVLGLLRGARAMLRQARKAALDAGVEERRVRVTQAVHQRLAQAPIGALDDVAHLMSDEARAEFKRALGRQVRFHLKGAAVGRN